MQYCTIEEAWGPTFKKKKSKKERRLEKQEEKMLSESIDSEIVIPRMEDTKMADSRQTYQRQIPRTREQLDSFNGYDQYSSNFGSPYSSTSKSVEVTNTDILENNKRLEQQYNQPQQTQQTQQTPQPHHTQLETQLGKTASQELQKMMQIKQDDYLKLKEGFTNQTDDQFNQLLLFIFTGIFYLFMLDMMYQLGKKSY